MREMRRIIECAMAERLGERGLQPSLTRTHYSAGRVAALLSMLPKTLSAAQRRHLDAVLRFCPGANELRRFFLRFRAMLRWRSARKLRRWIEAAVRSGFRFRLNSRARC